jgi:hypothetical protein
MQCQVTLVESGEILGAFDRNLRDYAAKTLKKNGVVIKRGVVKEVQKDCIVLRCEHALGQRCAICLRLPFYIMLVGPADCVDPRGRYECSLP